MPRSHAVLPREAASPPLHLRLRTRVDDVTEKIALRAALVAAHLLGLAAGRFLRELRGRNDPLVEATALLKEAELRASVAWDVVDMLGTRLDKIPDRHRPYYSPAHRFRILEIKNFLGWNREVAARLFRICPNTLSNWEKPADPDSRTVGSTISPIPPITRLADVGRSLVQSMLRRGFGGEDLVAQALTRAGWKVSARSVRRIGRERERPDPVPPTNGVAGRAKRPVVAHFTARLERFWRTLKQALSLRLHPPLTIGDLERRLDVALTHYLCFRPHQGLLGATPGEAFLGHLPACRNAVSPPRGRPGEGPSLAPFVIEFLDPERKDFPFLKGA